MSFPRLSAPLAVAVSSAAVLWVMSNVVFAWLTTNSDIPGSFAALVVPASIPYFMVSLAAPWPVVVFALCGLTFAAVMGGIVAAASRGIRRPAFLTVWFASIAASFLTSVVFAVGALIANWPPIRLAGIFDGVRDVVLSGGYWGIVWGWLPATLALIVASRRRADATATPAPRRGRAAFVIGGAVVALALIVSVPVGLGATAQVGAPEPTAEPQPVYTPPPPASVAPGEFQIDPSWCRSDQLSIVSLGGDAATGHRMLTIGATNMSDTGCVLNGYPDVAFGNPETGDLGVVLYRGGSFMTEDAGATPITLEPGAGAIAALGWNANSTAGGGGTMTVYVAPYPGAERTSVPEELDVTQNSTAVATAWELLG
ncbi:MAG: hypothetical protein JWM51_1499 [Microbacteriaceae bacterium]|nr:hypothetical protein [Microbacteriaceae bacterium]